MSNVTEKITVTGNYIERKKYEKSINRALTPRNGGRKKMGYKSDNSAKYRNQTINAQKDSVRRKVLGNFGIGSNVLTLTFAAHITNHDEADIEFKNFVDRLRTRFKEEPVKYLAVYEFSEKGSIHFHMITNVSLSELLIRKLWGNGNEINIDVVQSLEQLQKTVSYLTKGFNDPRIGSRTPYKVSRNLIQSELFRNQEDIELVNRVYRLLERSPNLKRNYDSEFNGKIELEGFILVP